MSTVFMLCERSVNLINGKRLALSASERNMLEALNYDGLVAAHAQEEAVSCVKHFAAVRDRLLRAEPWVFAGKSASPAQLSSGLDGWAYSYNLPADCISPLTVVALRPDGGRPFTAERYEVAGRMIGCPYPSVKIRYTAKITDTNLWDPLFEDVFCFSLAMEITSGVTGEVSSQGSLEQRAMLGLERARAAGAIKTPMAIPLAGRLNGYSDAGSDLYRAPADLVWTGSEWI
ncbi:hypothetical protein FACS1894167_04760 [Synergistales bacterium]|nr:hypothetical protein FACS1894167_04760 [Synergistales bacterium]